MAREEPMLATVREYYDSRLREHGANARGVDWNSTESQTARFDQLLTLIGPDRRRFSLNDYGCGYGALFDYLRRGGHQVDYRGFDISTEMIARANDLHGSRPNASFFSDPALLRPADYTVASGLFNVKLDATESDWTAYVESTLAELASLSREGFAFNLLTSYADRELMQDRLFYADPCLYFDHCKRRFSRWVNLLHDYGLYEFTIIVRKDSREVERAWRD